MTPLSKMYLYSLLARPSTNATPPDPLQSRGTDSQVRTINVVLFGETGVGKSSVINLIARQEIAQVSSDVNGCTMQYKRYSINFDGMDFAIFDTIGLEEPQMGVNGYLKAIEKAYELISKLATAGGIHLLLFCMRGGRITATTQSNYRLFCECLCDKKVPIALVFTGLEREEEMENWWRRNKKHIEDYGIKSNDHACITAVQDDTPGEDHKYKQSQERIRDVLKSCARENEGFSPESNPWFARFINGMKGFVAGKRGPKKRDIMRVLTQRCKLDVETAKKIAAMMENGEAETKNKAPPAGNGEGGHEEDKSPPNDGNNVAMKEKGDTEMSKNREGKVGRDGSSPNKGTHATMIATETTTIKNPQAGNGRSGGGRDGSSLNTEPAAGVRNAEGHDGKKLTESINNGTRVRESS